MHIICTILYIHDPFQDIAVIYNYLLLWLSKYYFLSSTNQILFTNWNEVVWKFEWLKWFNFSYCVLRRNSFHTHTQPVYSRILIVFELSTSSILCELSFGRSIKRLFVFHLRSLCFCFLLSDALYLNSIQSNESKWNQIKSKLHLIYFACRCCNMVLLEWLPQWLAKMRVYLVRTNEK